LVLLIHGVFWVYLGRTSAKGKDSMSKHEQEQPKPDPTLNGSNPHPDQPLPPEDPGGKHEKKDDD
jgi:hypothetical protein